MKVSSRVLKTGVNLSLITIRQYESSITIKRLCSGNRPLQSVINTSGSTSCFVLLEHLPISAFRAYLGATTWYRRVKDPVRRAHCTWRNLCPLPQADASTFSPPVSVLRTQHRTSCPAGPSSRSWCLEKKWRTGSLQSVSQSQFLDSGIQKSSAPGQQC